MSVTYNLNSLPIFPKDSTNLKLMVVFLMAILFLFS